MLPLIIYRREGEGDGGGEGDGEGEERVLLCNVSMRSHAYIANPASVTLLDSGK